MRSGSTILASTALIAGLGVVVAASPASADSCDSGLVNTSTRFASTFRDSINYVRTGPSNNCAVTYVAGRGEAVNQYCYLFNSVGQKWYYVGAGGSRNWTLGRNLSTFSDNTPRCS